MAKFAVIARQALIDLLRRAKKGTMRGEKGIRSSGSTVLRNYSQWKKNVPARTAALESYRSKTGSAVPVGKVLIPKNLLTELKKTSSQKRDQEYFSTKKSAIDTKRLEARRDLNLGDFEEDTF